MKWKIDYPYVVCIVFLIGGGALAAAHIENAGLDVHDQSSVSGLSGV